jgi:multidrug efflux pump subunit AcrA (membrane-fusion protein)
MLRRVTFPRSRRALTLLGVAVLGLLVIVRLGLAAARSAGSATGGDAAANPALMMEVPPPVLAAHGVVQPIGRAAVGTLGGGSVSEISVQIGQAVDKGQILARVAAPNQTELVLAPWHGTVSSIAVHAGDSVVPGAVLLTLADPSRYQVETTDVDDYLIARIRHMQAVTVTLDASPQRRLRGRVLSISTQPQAAPGGGVHYATVIELAAADADLRPGTHVRVVFED